MSKTIEDMQIVSAGFFLVLISIGLLDSIGFLSRLQTNITVLVWALSWAVSITFIHIWEKKKGVKKK